MVVALGADDEAALQANDAVAERLAGVRDAGALDAFRSLHSFVWSRALQERNWAALAAQPQLADDMLAALEAEDFRSAAFALFFDALRGSAPQPLTMDDLLASPLAEAVLPHRVTLDGKVAVLTLLRGVRDPAVLVAALQGVPGVRYFDNEIFARSLYARHRTRSIELVGIGTAAVLVLLLLRYRTVGRALAAGAPGILGAIAALGVIAASGTPLNILHLLGLVLVLSLGADYGIFLVESDRDDPEDAASLLSVSLAALTTLFSFGLLSLSSFPALRSLGVATGIGVAVSPALSLCFRILRARTAPPAKTKEPS
jgi:predicted exporter